jgi:hypothetical protein
LLYSCPSGSSILRNSSASQPTYQKRPPVLPLDKPILLKCGLLRPHVHHYDLCLTIKKPKSDEDLEAMIQKSLQKFLEIMLQADPFTLIPFSLNWTVLTKMFPT